MSSALSPPVRTSGARPRLPLLVALCLATLVSVALAKGPYDRASLEEGWIARNALVHAVGPLYYIGHVIDDDMIGNSVGDNDGLVEPGETIELYIDITNVGSQTATGVTVHLSTANPHVTFPLNTSSPYGDVPGGAVARCMDDFEVVIDTYTSVGEMITFDLSMTASNGGPWTDSFTLIVEDDDPTVALVSDGIELAPVVTDLAGIGCNPVHMFNNWNGTTGVFTSNPAFLRDFDVVVWYGSGDGSGRLTTPTEAEALEAYLQAGGRLLVTGYDTIGSPDDPLLADLVRSTSMGDGPFEYPYSIVDGGHPVSWGPWGHFPTGYPAHATDSDHDWVHADGARGAVAVATLSSGADKIIATDLDPAPASGRIVYWNGNRDARDWLGPSPSASARRVPREAKPGVLSNEALRAKAIVVDGSELPDLANAAPGTSCLRLDDATLVTLQPTLRSQQSRTFPSSAASYYVASYPYWFNAGDHVVETVYTTMPVAERVILDLVISSNSLNGGASVDLLLGIGTLPVGLFSVFEGDLHVNVEFVFPGVDGPDYTVRLEETNTVPPGYGSIVIPPGLSTITFVRSQHELFRNALSWLGDGATRRDPHEVNDTPGQCTPISPGVPVTDAYIDPRGDWDYYCFSATAGQTVTLDVDAWTVGSLLDAVLTLFDSGGTPLAESDDVHGLDPFLTYPIPTNDVYVARVRSYGHPCCGGPDYFYTLLMNLSPVAALESASALIVAGIEAITPLPAAGPVAITYGITRPDLPHRLDVYDVAGRLVRTLASGPSVVGRHRRVWDGRGVASGVYFVSLEVGEEHWTRKATILR